MKYHAHYTRRRLHLSVFGLILLTTLLGGCDLLFGPGGTAGDDFSAFQPASLTEINFLRSDPSGYAEARLLDDHAAGTDNYYVQDFGSQ